MERSIAYAMNVDEWDRCLPGQILLLGSKNEVELVAIN
jgi:hypothetical protein